MEGRREATLSSSFFRQQLLFARTAWHPRPSFLPSNLSIPSPHPAFHHHHTRTRDWTERGLLRTFWEKVGLKRRMWLVARRGEEERRRKGRGGVLFPLSDVTSSPQFLTACQGVKFSAGRCFSFQKRAWTEEQNCESSKI